MEVFSCVTIMKLLNIFEAVYCIVFQVDDSSGNICFANWQVSTCCVNVLNVRLEEKKILVFI